MMKRLSALLSLGVIGIGIWLVSRGREVDRICKVNSISGNGNGSFNHCTNLISTYFLGYALCVLGFILFLASILTIRHHYHRVKLQAKGVRTGPEPPDDSNPFRAVMRQEKPSGGASKSDEEERQV
jgi:hypothetical protein